MRSKKSEKTLPRGSACISCRKKKLKCDGTRPTCTPCIKVHKIHECEYDRKPKSRTQMLKEQLAMLEEKIQKLEGTDNVVPVTEAAPFALSAARFPLSADASNPLLPENPPLYLHAFPSYDRPTPPGITNMRSIDSILTSASLTAILSDPLSPTDYVAMGASSIMDFPLQGINLPMRNSNSSLFPIDIPEWYESEDTDVPHQTKQMLMSIFISHRHQCSFGAHISKFQIYPSRRQHQKPHPALMNAVYLLACHFARSPLLSGFEPVFFARTLQEIAVALHHSDRLVDVVQASCLLAVYLFANYRIMEGYHHSFSAARLAVGLGLHQIQACNSLQSIFNVVETGGAGLEPFYTAILPPQDTMELNDRIATFWQVFTVDRCWSVVHGLPSALSDGGTPSSLINTPWPKHPDELEKFRSTSFDTVRSVYEQQATSADVPVFLPALKAKATVLYERTSRLMSNNNHDCLHQEEHRSASLAVARFLATIPPFNSNDQWRIRPPKVDVDLFAIHTMLIVAYVYLQKDFIKASIAARQRTIRAGKSILTLIRALGKIDYTYLDPILSACWLSMAKMFLYICEYAAKHPEESICSLIDMESDLKTLTEAMKELGVTFPLSTTHAQKIQQAMSKTFATI